VKGNHSFPAASRLRSSREFQNAWQQGRRYHTTHFILILCPNRLNRSRLGLTVSRKVGNAVCRNRLKRRLREYFRHHLKHLDRFLDISIIAKRQAGSLTHDQLHQELHKVIARLETENHV
jgi:ribonuclease P protein component